MEKITSERLIDNLHTIANKKVMHGNYNQALEAVSVCAALEYEYNQNYVDEGLEQILRRIAMSFPKTKLSSSSVDKNTVLFYDGFGMDARGLALIYLKALCNLGFQVIYVTHIDAAGKQPQLEKETRATPMTSLYLPRNISMLTYAKRLMELFEIYHPAYAFFYTMPSDAAAVLAFTYFEGIVKRYQVNLTDHAFWLGKDAFDYCVEFRDYGASISCLRREIPKEKLAMLPYYPYIDYSIPFEGYPFPFDENSQKLVFSGGSLYKTLGAENQYYQMVESILKMDETVIFWYAGSGDRTEMDKLIKKYPGRVYLTSERRDLYQLLRKCVFYLSTYPLAGGLMYQYAAAAEKVPLTLDYEKNEAIWGMLLGEKKLEIHFDHMQDLLEEAKRLLLDVAYRSDKEKAIARAILSPEQFQLGLKNLLETGTTTYPMEIREIDDAAFLKTYADRMNMRYLCTMIAKPKAFWLARYFPIEYLLGVIWKVPAWINILQRRRKGKRHGNSKT